MFNYFVIFAKSHFMTVVTSDVCVGFTEILFESDGDTFNFNNCMMRITQHPYLLYMMIISYIFGAFKDNNTLAKIYLNIVYEHNM